MRLFVMGIVVAVVAAVVAISLGPRGEAPSASSITADVAGFSERYQPYSEQTLAASGVDETVVLFFTASWCSTCKVLRDDIAANQQSIPEGVRILLVDYDNSTEMKQKYGVVSPTTLVQVDRTGLGIARWELSRSLDDLLAEIIEI